MKPTSTNPMSPEVRQKRLENRDAMSEAMHTHFTLDLMSRLRLALVALKQGHQHCKGSGCHVCKLLQTELPDATARFDAEGAADLLWMDAWHEMHGPKAGVGALDYLYACSWMAGIVDDLRHAQHAIGEARAWSDGVSEARKDKDWGWVTETVLPSAAFILGGLETNVADNVREVSSWEYAFHRAMQAEDGSDEDGDEEEAGSEAPAAADEPVMAAELPRATATPYWLA